MVFLLHNKLWIMEFRTQRELLEYLGKNPNDRKLVSRMRIRWDVRKEGWVYILTKKDELIWEIEKWKEEYKKIIEECNRLANENARLIKDKNELIQRIIESDKWSSEKSVIVNKVYKYLTQVLHIRIDKSEFIEWIDNN